MNQRENIGKKATTKIPPKHRIAKPHPCTICRQLDVTLNLEIIFNSVHSYAMKPIFIREKCSSSSQHGYRFGAFDVCELFACKSILNSLSMGRCILRGPCPSIFRAIFGQTQNRWIQQQTTREREMKAVSFHMATKRPQDSFGRIQAICLLRICRFPCPSHL